MCSPPNLCWHRLPVSCFEWLLLRKLKFLCSDGSSRYRSKSVMNCLDFKPVWRQLLYASWSCWSSWSRCSSECFNQRKPFCMSLTSEKSYISYTSNLVKQALARETMKKDERKQLQLCVCCQRSQVVALQSKPPKQLSDELEGGKCWVAQRMV